MKNLYVSLTILLSISSSFTYAQSAQDNIISDLLFIAGNFAQPAAEGASYQASAGWFTSASSLKKWKVEVSIHGNALFVPSNRNDFSVSNSDFKNLQIVNDNNVRVPSAFGTSSSVSFEGEFAGNSFSFDALEGIDKQVLIHPFVQATVGLPFKTEVSVRYLPEATVNDVGFSTYGVGIKHNISQYFGKYNPEEIQLAALVTYSKFNVDYDFSPVDIEIANLNRIDVDANLWFFEALASKRYENFEVFGALGATSSNFGYQMNGSGPALPLINNSLETLDDTKAQFKGDIGFNVYIQSFKISAMATAGKFFNLNLGVHYKI